MTHEITHIYLMKYVPKLGASKFFDDRIDEMTREELLGLVAWMQEEEEARRARDDQQLKFERQLRRIATGRA